MAPPVPKVGTVGSRNMKGRGPVCPVPSVTLSLPRDSRSHGKADQGILGCISQSLILSIKKCYQAFEVI